MVSFKNESIQERIENRRKMQSSSIELVIVFLVIIFLAGVFGVMVFYKSNLNKEIEVSNNEIDTKNKEMQRLMVGEKADFYKRMDLMKKNIFKAHSSVDILEEIEKNMVPRVVLLSFSHSVEKTGTQQVVISADADDYSLMAQQIAEFKKSNFFKNVRVNDTSMDNVGRIVFSIKMEVASTNYLFFPNNESEEENSENIENLK